MVKILRSPFVCFLAALVVLIPSASQAQKKTGKNGISGFADFNAYYDTRQFSVFTINLLANLPYRFQYFSLTNFQSPKRSFDLESLYTEQNLRWGVHKNVPLDLTFQYVIRNGKDNDDFRFGLRWVVNKTPGLDSAFHKIHLTYSVNPMFIQFRSKAKPAYMTIIEHVYRLNIAPGPLNNRLYIGGFVDQNFVYSNSKVSLKWVSEHQLGIRLVSQLYAVAEFRINTFLPDEQYGLGYGLEYKVIF
ncbi:hypothetical protein ACFLR1_02180 [Bacteroidota bacterium]